MGGHLTGLHQYLGQQTGNWLQLLFATPVVLWAGWPLLERGWRSIQNRSLNMFTLIAMGIGVAWLYSVAATVAPGSSRRRSGARKARRGLFRGGPP